MNIAGLQKMTLLDYPGKVACTVFLPGCNFRCPFCHNSGLLDTAPQVISEAELLAFLEKRKKLLDGVCITGGEPTLQPGLAGLLRSIKALGYPVKLDTNGSRPEVLKALVSERLVDYVAMDIKNSPRCYPETVGTAQIDLSVLEESIRFLLTDPVDYEFRTTVVDELHSAEAMQNMGKWLSSLQPGKLPKRWFLQCFRDRDSVLFGNLHAPGKEKMADYIRILQPYTLDISLRGAD